MPLFNLFSDDALRARQDQLDAQWKSTWALYQGCDQTPDSAFSEFASDKVAWDAFYDSGSDWSDDSKHATDEWQTKLKEWETRLSTWGCFGTTGDVDLGRAAGAIPTIKDPPPDGPSFIDKSLKVLRKTEDAVLSPFATLGWVSLGLAVLVILAIVWIVTKGRAKGYGVELGGK